MLPLINRPTRISQNSATLIDNIFTNNINTIEKDQQGILVTDITDRFPVFCVSSCHKQLMPNDSYICRRNYCYNNKLAFQRALSETNWSEMYMQCDNVQSAFSMFHSRYVDLVDKHFPKRKIKSTYSNRNPWLTSALKQSIRKKNRLYAKFKRIQCSYNECHYKIYRNQHSSLLKYAEKTYYADLLKSNKSNLKKTWNILKHIVNKKKGDKMQEKFKRPDNSITNDKYFFVNVGHNLAKHIPNVGIFPRNFMGDWALQTIFMEPVTDSKIVHSLKNGAPGYDGVPSQILKDTINTIIDPLCFLCNHSLEQGVFPSELKLANVLPLFKSGDAMLFNNYRPVSLLCTLSKVFEKVM